MFLAPLADRPVLAEVTAILREVLDDPEIDLTPDTVAADVPGWDSMAHIALVVETECRFGIAFQAAEIEALHRVGDLVRLVEAKRSPT
ncbi:MAG: acyl carrier protein [Proteobacteria bacterium]|nr:acyl carrier protein [Pseudomonadota bacterium]